jgi:hypothetical protein
MLNYTDPPMDMENLFRIVQDVEKQSDPLV